MNTKLHLLKKELVMLLVCRRIMSFTVFSHFRQMILAFLCLLVLNLVFQSYEAEAQTTEDYDWKNVAIGGGGFVSAIITSKTEQNLVYARTDVGGAYRWNASTSSWVPLLDWVSDDEVGYLGVESLAIDPQSPNRVYMLVGISYFNNGKTAILRSDDYGNTFSVSDVTSQFKAHGNGMGRQTGEKLVVDPINSNILYCGTRRNGLFKSTDAGATWSRLSSLDITSTPNDNGISFVVLDESIVSGGTTQRIIVGVSRNGSTNLYRSDDGGQSFSAVSDATTTYMPHRAVLASSGDLYVTYANGAGPHGHWAEPEPMDNGQIWKYNVTSGAWTNITPSGYARAFGGISVDPNNPERLVASTINSYLYQNGAWGDRIFLSTNGGSSWVDVVERGFTMDPDGITWVSGHAIHWAGSIEFDPFDTEKVWVTSGNGLFVNDNISSSDTWRFTVRGLEETVPLGLESIPNGPVISVVGDYDGFRHTNLDQYAPIHNPQIGTTTGLAVAAQNTNKIVRVGNSMYYSTDMGLTWTQNNMNGTQGKVALSADGNIVLHSPRESSITYRSINNGSSWSTVSGLSFNEALPVADPVNSNKFYAYNRENGAVLVSTNGGSSFSQASSVAGWGSKVIRLAPGMEGDVWIALNNGGLARSTDSGQSFSTISGISNCAAVGFGIAAPDANYPTIYIWGTVNGVRGLYRSTDQAVSWMRVNDDAHQYGGPGNGQFVQGDMNVFGRVYMSTAGRGIVYGEPGTVSTDYTLTTSINGSGTISMDPSGGTYAAGTVVTVTANPASGWQFSSWSGDLSGSNNPTTITMNSNKSITATFTESVGVSSTMHVQNIITYTQSENQGNKRGVAEVTILDNLGNPVSAATVTGTFLGSFNETRTAQTGSNGVAVLTTSTSVKGKVTLDICVNNVTHGSLTYNNTDNVFTCTGTVTQFASENISEDVLSTDQINLAIYPNPVEDGRFKIDLPTGMAHADIMIFDLRGKLIYQQNSEGQQNVEIHTMLTAGLYVVKVQSGYVVLTGKLVVK